MLFPEKLVFSVEIHRAVFFKIPPGEIQNTFHGFGRSFPVVNRAAGGTEEQEHHQNEQYAR
jgi:hypothetical protein